MRILTSRLLSNPLCTLVYVPYSRPVLATLVSMPPLANRGEGVGGVYGLGCGVTPCDCTHVLVEAALLSSSGSSTTVPSAPVSRTVVTLAFTAGLSAESK